MERRRYPRIQIEEGVVALHNREPRIGKLKDIGLGGLAFEHIYEEDLLEGEGEKNLTLLLRDLRVAKIPCRVIYNLEVPVPPEYERLAIRLTTRRCGLKFGLLTDQQRHELERLLNLGAGEKADLES
ncbi:MAG: PilZ domain-containing protein [Desulfobacterota bacterium]|nr:PilZ domain-containing protein [Thermodesulfobacteriota bacterium]